MSESTRLVAWMGEAATKRLALACLCLSKLSKDIALAWHHDKLTVYAATGSQLLCCHFPKRLFDDLQTISEGDEVITMVVNSKFFSSAFHGHRRATRSCIYEESYAVGDDGTVRHRVMVSAEFAKPDYSRITSLTYEDASAVDMEDDVRTPEMARLLGEQYVHGNACAQCRVSLSVLQQRLKNMPDAASLVLAPAMPTEVRRAVQDIPQGSVERLRYALLQIQSHQTETTVTDSKAAAGMKALDTPLSVATIVTGQPPSVGAPARDMHMRWCPLAPEPLVGEDEARFLDTVGPAAERGVTVFAVPWLRAMLTLLDKLGLGQGMVGSQPALDDIDIRFPRPTHVGDYVWFSNSTAWATDLMHDRSAMDQGAVGVLVTLALTPADLIPVAAQASSMADRCKVLGQAWIQYRAATAGQAGGRPGQEHKGQMGHVQGQHAGSSSAAHAGYGHGHGQAEVAQQYGDQGQGHEQEGDGEPDQGQYGEQDGAMDEDGEGEYGQDDGGGSPVLGR